MFADQSSRPLHEREFVRQATLEKDTDAGMAQCIGSGDQRDIARYLQVRQVAGLGQDEKFAGDRTLNLVKFPAKILDEDVMQPLIDLNRFLANEFETFV